MNKKGEGLVETFIAITVVVLLIATFAIPVIKQSTDSNPATESYTKTLTNANETLNLSNTPVVENSLSISGLTVTANYTVDYTLGRVVFLADATTNASAYNLTYEYTLDQYLDNSMERALMAIVILALIIGLIVWIFGQFDLA